MEKYLCHPCSWRGEVGQLWRVREGWSNVPPAGLKAQPYLRYRSNFSHEIFFQLSIFREILSLVLPSVTSPVFKQFLEKQVN